MWSFVSSLLRVDHPAALWGQKKEEKKEENLHLLPLTAL
jgi:hypothetical protein